MEGFDEFKNIEGSFSHAIKDIKRKVLRAENIAPENKTILPNAHWKAYEFAKSDENFPAGEERRIRFIMYESLEINVWFSKGSFLFSLENF